jgi:hypothetical protein
MVYRRPDVAPAGSLSEEQRGAEVGLFCHGCGSVYPLHRAHHHGKPTYGKDHIAATCVHEGEEFDADATWWEPAFEVLDPAPSEAPTAS